MRYRRAQHLWRSRGQRFGSSVDQPTLRNVHPIIHSLQRQAAAHLLSLWGIERLPGLLTSLLERNDLEFALVYFFGRLGAVDLGVLLDPSHPDHAELWRRVEAALGLLLRIEQEAQNSTLDAAPLYESLSGPLNRAEDLFNLYRQATPIWRLIEETEVGFPLYRSFRDDVLKAFTAWHTLSAEDLAEAFNVQRDYVSLHEMFEQVTAELDVVFARLGKREAELEEELRAVALRMLEEKEGIVAAILNGRRRPDEGVGRLYALLEKLKLVADHAGFAGDSGKRSGGKRDEEMRLEYCALLGVTKDASPAIIKAAYRKLAKKYHPDVNDDKSATEKFRQIKAAYEWLLRAAMSETRETIR